MNAVKMGMTIEEAAECHAVSAGTPCGKLVDWGKLPVSEGRAQDHYPQGHAGAFYDRQSGQKSTRVRMMSAK